MITKSKAKSDRRQQILVASNNHGKSREISEILRNALPNVSIVYPSELSLTLKMPDEGDDYYKNALTKANAALDQSGLASVADDSGLEIDALYGAPGVFSARYGATDEERIKRILRELDAAKGKLRTARFRCVAVFAMPSGRHIMAEGVWEGIITSRPIGKKGFGYDPIFFDPVLGKTAAEMAPREKSSRSHRSRALRILAKKLARLEPWGSNVQAGA